MKQQQQVKPLHSIHVQFPRNKSVDLLTRSWKRTAGTWITTQSKVATPVSGDTHALSKSSKLNKPWSISIHDFFDALEFQNWIPRYCGEKVFIWWSFVVSDIESRRSLIFYPTRKRERSRLNVFPESNSFRITPKNQLLPKNCTSFCLFRSRSSRAVVPYWYTWVGSFPACGEA